MMRITLVLFLFGLTNLVAAQAFFRSVTLSISPGESISLSVYEPFDGLCIEVDQTTGLELISQKFGTHALAHDRHHGEGRTQLFTFPKEHGSLQLHSSNFKGALKLLLIDQGASVLPFDEIPLHKKNNCEKPEFISPAIWRAGLPEPKKGRTFNAARHMIIHHSAGSNFNTNYTEVVRSIYLLHVNTNNWDDIGYNYLIAGNGTIYAGRDPQDLLREDEVTGAHFCSKNTGTMGTCILGTYTDTTPSSESIESLRKLLLWKLAKEHIGPADSFPHPNNSDPMLPVVAGHRDGCNTTCPGDAFYRLIPPLRQQLESEWQQCPKIAGTDIEPRMVEALVFPNPIPANVNTITLNFSGHWQLYSVNGQRLEEGEVEKSKIELRQIISPGLYFIHLQNLSTSKLVPVIKW